MARANHASSNRSLVSYACAAKRTYIIARAKRGACTHHPVLPEKGAPPEKKQRTKLGYVNLHILFQSSHNTACRCVWKLVFECLKQKIKSLTELGMFVNRTFMITAFS